MGNQSKGNQADFFKMVKMLYLIFLNPFIEFYSGIRTKQIPLSFCLLTSSLVQVMMIVGLDFLLLKKMGLAFLYPVPLWLKLPYMGFMSLSGFWAWGLFQVALKVRLTKKLTEVFINTGLKNALNKLPSFVFDRPIDEWARRLRLYKNGLTKKQFVLAKDGLESGLHIFIDDIRENRKQGTLDIVYSHTELERYIDYDLDKKMPKGSFIIGKTRAKNILGSLKEIPHLLIAGETGGGKSTFLRQIITTLYLNNKNFKFELIDLKGGLELQVFEGLKRVRIFDSSEKAVKVLKRLNETSIEGRKKLFKANHCNDIDSFLKISANERIFPDNNQFLMDSDRVICVIDEAFDLFMKGDKVQSRQAQEARTHANKIAAQGRALGIHLIIGTQRPDRNSIDPLTKANLPGKLCFSMANNVSSQTILDSKRAADIPTENKGRAIWKAGKDMLEVQTPFLSKEETIKLLAPYKTKDQSLNPQRKKKTAQEVYPTDFYNKSKSRKEFSIN